MNFDVDFVLIYGEKRLEINKIVFLKLNRENRCFYGLVFNGLASQIQNFGKHQQR